MRRGMLVVVAGLALAGVMVASGCAPPTAPGPTVRPQPPGRGRHPEIAVAPSAGCAATDAATATRTSVTVSWGGAARTALLATPAGDGPHPLLVSLHPFTLGPEIWEQYSGLADAAVARGYVVVTPLGSDPGPRWAVPGGLATDVDDIGFVSALLDDIEDEHCIDANREFAAGFSAGAAMAQALSCTLAWRFAAVAGSGGTNLTSTCPDSPPTDVFVLHGTADPIAPPTGSEIAFAPPQGLPVAAVVATDAARAGCEPVPVTTSVRSDVEADTYQGCDGGHRVQYWRMLGGGHSWAGAPDVIGGIVGPTLTSFSATGAVLDFFDAT